MNNRLSNTTESDAKTAGGSSLPIGKLALMLGLVGVVGTVYWQLGDSISLDNLAKQESALREYQADHPVLVYGIALLVYVSFTGLSLPGASVLTLVIGWYFGWFEGVILVSFASTAGATLAFLLSRFLFRSSIQKRFGSTLSKFNDSLEREGPFYLFTLRLIPAVPFFVINAVMGLTPMKVFTFWWVSQVGMFAGTLVYVYAGSRVPNLQSLAEDGINAVFSPTQMAQILFAFALLGIFPFVVRGILKLLNHKTHPSA